MTNFSQGLLLFAGFGVLSLFDSGAWCEGYYLLGRAFYFFAGWESDDAGALLFNSEDAEAAELDAGFFHQAVDDFIKHGLNDAR